MGWKDALKRVEQQGRDVAHRSADLAREGWEELDDAQRRLRQRMRLWPESRQEGQDKKKAIISIHGRDVEETEAEDRRDVA